MANVKRIILGITGASGAIYSLRTLQALHKLDVETHLIISPMGRRVLAEETGVHLDVVHKLAAHVHASDDLGAPIASGSFHTDGMLIVPCSIKTLSGVANSYTENLIQRAADVCLKEGRPLLLAVRETPLHPGHLRLMAQAAQAGAVIFPPIPAFYQQPKTIDELVSATVGRMLSRIGIENDLAKPWGN
ncbi:UbiX family flavin prenyltransferase [bacterium]|nr:UbiX family flavin prenyltransferase [bacterium]